MFLRNVTRCYAKKSQYYKRKGWLALFQLAKFGKALPCSILPAFFQRNSIVPIDCLVVDCLRLSSESPKSGKARRSHSMRSRGSKSFRFLQIISAANKQYAGARAPDRQQAAALAACIPLRRFAASLQLFLKK